MTAAASSSPTRRRRRSACTSSTRGSIIHNPKPFDSSPTRVDRRAPTVALRARGSAAQIAWSGTGGGRVSEAEVRQIVLGIVVFLALIVLAMSLALSAAETRDERDILVSLGARPSTMRAVSSWKAALLAASGALGRGADRFHPGGRRVPRDRETGRGRPHLVPVDDDPATRPRGAADRGRRWRTRAAAIAQKVRPDPDVDIRNRLSPVPADSLSSADAGSPDANPRSRSSAPARAGSRWASSSSARATSSRSTRRPTASAARGAHNTYPGAQCDVPSHLYSFSFELNPWWSRTYATQPEILAYLERCTDQYGLRPHLRTGTRHRRGALGRRRAAVEPAVGDR